MKAKDLLLVDRAGVVRAQWIGSAEPARAFSNKLLYASADALAALVAGDTRWQPRYVGFLFGNVADPGWATVIEERDQTWQSIRDEFTGIGISNGNMLRVPISTTPSIKVAPGAGTYIGNAAVFTAVTQSGDSNLLAYPPASYKAGLTTGDFIYGAVLFAKPGAAYVPIARVSLADGAGVYPQKQEDKELALFWQISFF